VGCSVGKRGFLLTCDNEVKAVSAAINLLNHFVSEYSTEEQQKVTPAVTNTVDESQSELKNNQTHDNQDQGNEDKKENRKHFQVVHSGCKGTVAILFSPSLPSEQQVLPSHLMSYILPRLSNLEDQFRKLCKYMNRLLPMDVICEAKCEAIVLAAKSLVLTHFPIPPDPRGPDFQPNQYSIIVEKRNNSLDKDVIIKEVASIVHPSHCVNLSNPDLCIVIQIIKSACGIAIVKNYQYYRKFNVQILSEKGPLLPQELTQLENKNKVKNQNLTTSTTKRDSQE